MLALADFSNDEGWSWPSIPTLAKKARISDRHVRRILKALEEAKVLEVDHRNGRNNTNRYKLTLPICPVLFEIQDAETLTSETQKGTPESVKEDKLCPINRQEPPQLQPSLEPCTSQAKRETEFIDLLSKYWKYKNPNVTFAFTAKDRRNLRVLLADLPPNVLPTGLFHKCLNNRARDPAVWTHTEAIHRWICRILEWAEPRGNHGKQHSKVEERNQKSIANIARGISRVVSGDGRTPPSGGTGNDERYLATRPRPLLGDGDS